MADEGGFLSDIYGGARKAADLVGIGEAISIGATAKDMIPGAGLTPGADKVMGPLGMITSGIDLATGGYSLGTGIAKSMDGQDAGVEYCDAAHDLLGGGAGMLGNVPGPVGAVAKSFSAGFAVGDMIAPHVFGSEEEDNKPHTETIPEDGVFKPSTGNQYVDGALDIFGIRD